MVSTGLSVAEVIIGASGLNAAECRQTQGPPPLACPMRLRRRRVFSGRLSKAGPRQLSGGRVVAGCRDVGSPIRITAIEGLSSCPSLRLSKRFRPPRPIVSMSKVGDVPPFALAMRVPLS